MFKAKFIAAMYCFVFLTICALLVIGQAVGPAFRADYGNSLIQLLQGVVAAFIGFLTAFAADREKE